MSPSPPHPGRLRRFGLRTEVGALVAAISVTASIAAGALAYRQMTELTHDAGRDHATAVLEALSVPAAVAIADNDLPKLDSFVAELVTRGSVISLEVLDLEGRVLATSRRGMVGVESDRPEEDLPEDFVAIALRSAGRHWHFGPSREAPSWLALSYPIQLGQRWGTLIGRFSLRSLTEKLEDLELTVIALSALSALLGWLVSVFLLDRLVVRPVRQLTYMAQRLGEGELDIRTAYRRRDEVGDLSTLLNTMARRLERYTTGLEGAVRERTADLEIANQELERLATTDGLTGLRNHRYFQDVLDKEVKRGARHPRPLTLCMLDVDHFKHFNDTHGHPAGDVVLKTLAQLVQDRLRSTDIVARYGGEEFAIILLDTPGEDGEKLAKELAEVIRSAAVPGAEDQPLGRLTVSIGIATFPVEAADRVTLIRRADAALYAAKREGRDRVVRWTEDLGESARHIPSPHPPEEGTE